MSETHFLTTTLFAIAFTLMVFPGLSRTQDATTSSTTATASSASSTTTVNPSQSAWVVPITGPGDDPASPWGVNMTIGDDLPPKLVPIVFSNNTQQRASSSSSSSAGVFPNAKPFGDSNNPKPLQVNLGDAKNPTLVLGANAALGVSDSTTTIPTIPFGLNIGKAGEWNGSLILGRSYDANRIYGQTDWVSVPEGKDTRNTFLANGQLAIDSVRVRIWEYSNPEGYPDTDDYPFGRSQSQRLSYSGPAVLNFSSDSLVFPTKELCGKNITLDFNLDAAYENQEAFMIPIHADLTTSSSRCTEDQLIGSTPDAPPMTFGLPFFQAAYLYVNEDAEIFFSSTIEWDLPVNPKPFDESQTLELYGPTSPTHSAPEPTSSKGEGRKVQPMGALVAIVSMAMGLFLF